MSSPDRPPLPGRMLRSFLFAPGANGRILSKAMDAGADAVVCDLEDSVPVADKAGARQAVAAAIAARAADAGCQLHVRVDRGADGYDEQDLDAVVVPGLAGLRLPKAAHADEVAAVAHLVGELERTRGMPAGAVGLHPTIESAEGVDRVRELAAAPRVVSLVFGSADFLADIAAHGGDGRDATLLARSAMVLASRNAGIRAPVDGAYTGLDDLAGLRESTRWARSLGFFGRSAIHPRQLAVIHDVFTPTPEEMRWARRVLAAAQEGGGTAVVDAQFVDAPVLRRARDLLALVEGVHR